MITPSGGDPNTILPPGWAPPGGGYTPGSPMPPTPPSKSGCVGCSSTSKINFSELNLQHNNMNNLVQSWYDIPLQQPHDPRSLIANSYIDLTQGVFTRSSLFGAATWAASPLVYNGASLCTSLHTDDALAVAEAAQWTFSHQGLNLGNTNPPCLQKVAFLRGGSSYEMSFGIDFGGSNHTNVMLSFRDNAATPGDFAGSGQVLFL